MTIQEMLRENNMSVYKLSKASAVPYATCNDILMHGIRSLDRFQAHRKHMVIFNVLTSSRGGKQAIILKYNKSKQREGNTVSLPKEF